MKAVQYFSARKNPQHSTAIAAGWGARQVPIETARMARDAELHLCGGLQSGGLEIMKEVRHSGVPYVFFDRAYFGGGPGTNRLRATFGAYQKNWIEQRPPDRFEKTGVELKPWREDGRHILLVPPSAAIANLFNCEALIAILPALLARTGRPVDISVKGDPRPLSKRLEDCWAVVTWTSNVAVEAICAGVPAFVSRYSAAEPVAGTLDQIENLMKRPPMPEREAWAWSLAYGEFDLAEIASGYARSVIMDKAIA